MLLKLKIMVLSVILKFIYGSNKKYVNGRENYISLIDKSAQKAVECVSKNISGVIGLHEKTNEIECIDFSEIKGGKIFDVNQDWFIKLLESIN